MHTSNRVVAFSRTLSESTAFHGVILVIILLNAVIVGLETSRDLVSRHGAIFWGAHVVVLTIFVAELAIRVAAHGLNIGRFLRDGWNVFDLVVVALSLLPGAGTFTTVARVARVLRVARLVSFSPKLRLIVGTMMRSIPSLGHVSLLLLLLLYLYAVVGVNLFADHDPARWGSLGPALLTLFQMLTLEEWVDVQRAVSKAVPWAWLYFASFVVLAVFVVVNLFIAVVLNNLDEIREEDRVAARAEEDSHHLRSTDDFEQHLTAIRAELDRLEALHRQLKDGSQV